MAAPQQKDVMASLVDHEHMRYGMYRGIVLDNKDPLRIGRLRVFVPEGNMPDTQIGSAKDTRPLEEYCWMPYVSPFGGMHNSGFFFPPEVGAVVVVGYFAGNPNNPFWMGTVSDEYFHNSPLADIGSKLTEYPKNRMIRTPKGWMMEFDDSDGYERFEITSPMGNSFAIEDYRQGGMKVKMRGPIFFDSDSDIIMNASGKISMHANQGIDAVTEGDINMVTPQSVNVEGELNTQSNITIQKGDLRTVDGGVNANGNVLATGNVLCEGVSSNHHQHIVIAEAIDRDKDGKEIVDKRLIRASHHHTYEDKHIKQGHKHSERNDIFNEEPTDSATNLPENRTESYNNATEFDSTLRVTQRDCHNANPDPETRRDEITKNDDMSQSAPDHVKAGKTGKLTDPSAQQKSKRMNPKDMVSEEERSHDVIVEQVDRDYYEKNDKQDTPYVALRHNHSVRGIAI